MSTPTPATNAHAHAVHILCAEDNPDHVELIGFALERSDPGRHYALQRVDDAAGFTAAVTAGGIDVILCDYNLPQFSPYVALKILDGTGSRIPLIVVTQAIGEEAAVNVLRHGAKDYLTKDKLATLPQIIERVMDDRARERERESLAGELEAAYERLKMLSSSLVVAQERERTLISRELHDVLGQTLTGMMIHLHAAERSGDAPVAKTYTATALQMAQEAITQVRTMSFSLRPAQLDLLGLTAAVSTAVQRIAEPAGLAFAVTSRGGEPKKLRETASVAVRVVQEALTNVVRHAHASRVAVRLRFLPGDRIVVLVADDGDGFDKHEVLGGESTEKNLGLYGMIERVELTGGRLNIRSQPGRGAAVRAVL